MARPISMDLRERAMERLDRGQTVREVATVLDVLPRSVELGCNQNIPGLEPVGKLCEFRPPAE